MRWIVGDVHGCADELEELLETVRFDPAADELWSTGDLINRGPDSPRAVRVWRQAGGRGVLGNHDAYVLKRRSETSRKRRPATLQAFGRAADGEELLDALRSLRLLEPVGPGPEGREVWLIHAGLHPEWRDLPETAARLQRGANKDSWLDAPDTDFATLVRHCTPEGRLCGTLPDGRPEDRRALPWDTFYDGAAWIVHGHWAQRGAYRGRRTIGLDSGCVYGQELTAWTPDEDRWVRVPSRQPRR